MKGIFDYDSPLVRFLTRVADLMLVSLFCLMGSIPVVTVGASIAAAHKVIYDIHHGEEKGMTKTFFQAFRDNFRNATLGWMLYLFVFALLFIYLLMVKARFNGMTALVLYLLLANAAVIVLGNACYFFPMLSRYENPLFRHMYNGLLLTVGKLPRTLVMIALQISPLIMYMLSPVLFYRTIIIWLLLGLGAIVFLQQWLLKPVFLELEKNK